MTRAEEIISRLAAMRPRVAAAKALLEADTRPMVDRIERALSVYNAAKSPEAGAFALGQVYAILDWNARQDARAVLIENERLQAEAAKLPPPPEK